MLPLKEVNRSLKSLQGICIQELFYRFISVEYIGNLLNSIGSLQGGRYNLRNSFEVLYLSPNPQTAIAETTKPHKFKFPPAIIVTIEVRVQSILDFENKQTCKILGIDRKKLFSPWRIPSKIESYTQTLGRLIYKSRKFEGIRYPSAVVREKYNLAIFPDRLKKESKIKIYDPDKLIETSL